MNSSCDIFCRTHVPSMSTWRLLDHVQGGCLAQIDQVNWPPPATFINRSFPCPPLWNLCLFWTAMNSSSFQQNHTHLNALDIEIIRRRCEIPLFETCQFYIDDVSPSNISNVITRTDAYPACGTLCWGLIVTFIVVLLAALALIIWWTKRHSKRESSGTRCCGIILCDGGSVFRRPHLGRTESRKPALDEDVPDGKTRNKKSRSRFYVNFEKDNEEAVIGEKPSIIDHHLGHVNEAYVDDLGQKYEHLSDTKEGCSDYTEIETVKDEAAEKTKSGLFSVC